MKKFIILFKPRSLDDRVELDIVEENTNRDAMFKWLEKNRNTLKHFTGFINDPITDEQAKFFEEDYEKFREQFYKGSPYFGYN